MTTILCPERLADYGDDDGSIIWRSPLTSEASISSPLIGGGTYVKSGTGQLFDAIKGVKTGASGYYYVDNFTNNNKLDFGGQLCFDVETAMLACSNADSEGSSGGTPQTTNESLMGFADQSLGYNGQLYVLVGVKALSLQVGNGSVLTATSIKISDAIGKTQFTTIHVAWIGNTYRFFVNKVPVYTVTRPSNLTSPFRRLVIGMSPYAGAGQALTTAYIRNLQISTRPLALSSHPALARVQVFGDSYAEMSLSIVTDMKKDLNLRSSLVEMGIDCGVVNPQSYGGRKVIGSGNPALYLLDNVATALAQRPTCVIFQAGTNDLTQTGSLNATTFSDSMKLIIEKFFGVNGNPGTTVQRMLVCSTPWPPQYGGDVYAAERKPDIATIQIVQASLPAWFDAAYPALAGRLEYENMFDDFGGFSPNPTYYGAADLVHPSSKGHYVMGKAWGRGILKLLRN